MRISDWSSDVCSSDLETIARRWPELASRFSDDDLLECLRRLQKEHGYVTAQIIRDDELSPTPQLFTTRFGSLLNAYASHGLERSEERRVGKESVSTCRSRGSPEH